MVKVEHPAPPEVVKALTKMIREKFRCFGGGFYIENNPISIGLAKQPAQFVSGVDVAEVVRFVLTEAKGL